MRTVVLMWLALATPLTGCATNTINNEVPGSITRPQMDTRKRLVDGNQLPLRFVQHRFAVHCYDTLACHVESNGDGLFSMVYRNTRSPAYEDSIPRERWGLASYIGVSNWPKPAKVCWTSLDGVEHSAEVDFRKYLLMA